MGFGSANLILRQEYLQYVIRRRPGSIQASG
jgi:hypothetical protein